MTVHFIHIGKTGGTAIKWALRRRPKDWSGPPELGDVQVHRHKFTLDEVAPADHAFFCVRDPVSRYFSGFYSRQRKGQPRYYIEWTDRERAAFERYSTPQQLATELGSRNWVTRREAERAMRAIRHLRPMSNWLQDPDHVRARLPQIVYIARQETLDADWQRIKDILQLPARLRLPSDAVKAHRHDAQPEDRQLDRKGRAALERWYAKDFQLLAFCEQVRRDRGWDTT